MIPFAEYVPDQPDLGGGVTIARNVVPTTAQSYGPFPKLNPVSNVLPSGRPYGAGSFRDFSGNVYTFVANQTDIYRGSGVDWNKVSNDAGYITPSDGGVEFVQYGERVICALGPSEDLQGFLLKSSGGETKFTPLATGKAPKAKHIAVINNFVMVGNTVDDTDGARGGRVWWCAIDNPTDWPVIGSSDAAQKQSDFQDIPTGGHVQCIIGAVGGSDGAIFMEHAIYRVTYEGSPKIFRFRAVEEARGTPAPRSVINIGPVSYYLGEDGFYAFNGTQSVPIGSQRVDKTFFKDLDQNYFHRIFGAVDPINKFVAWSYPGAGNVDGRPNKILIYNWDINRWSFAEIEHEGLFRDLTTGYTLEQLSALGTLEQLNFSLDSRIWTGGRLVLSAFDTDSKLSRFAGVNLEATIATQEVGSTELLGVPNARIYVDGVRPYVDGGNPTVTLKHREGPGNALLSIGPNSIDADGQAHFDHSARFVRTEVIIPEGSTWSHAQGIDFTVTSDGEV